MQYSPCKCSGKRHLCIGWQDWAEVPSGARLSSLRRLVLSKSLCAAEGPARFHEFPEIFNGMLCLYLLKGGFGVQNHKVGFQNKQLKLIEVQVDMHTR